MSASSFWVAPIGPVSINSGSDPTRQESTIRASGFTPNLAAFSAVINKMAPAPSEICEEVPAVCTPSSRPDGLRLPSDSIVVSRMPSSRAMVVVSPVALPSASRIGASTGTIWVAKRSSSHARAARAWD